MKLNFMLSDDIAKW
uniref:Uncharacterized protein n=1 Tax=Anguilla anguilla TaxID=7936 RepID=A0A0E9TNZ2_ANGAN